MIERSWLLSQCVLMVQSFTVEHLLVSLVAYIYRIIIIRIIEGLRYTGKVGTARIA